MGWNENAQDWNENAHDGWGASSPPPRPPAIPQHQMDPPSGEDFFAGSGGAKGFSFDDAPPIRLGGVIVELPPLKQKTDYDTGEPLTWKDGRPRWIMPVLCQTDERVDEDDDGVRAHFLEYRKLKAVQEAVKKAGRTSLEVGGQLYITYLAPKPPKGGSKNYSAEYILPGAAAPAAQTARAQHSTLGQVKAARPAVQVAVGAGAPVELAQALVKLGMSVDQARLLPSLDEGWQGATAEQIMPYLVTEKPAYTDKPPF